MWYDGAHHATLLPHAAMGEASMHNIKVRQFARLFILGFAIALIFGAGSVQSQSRGGYFSASDGVRIHYLRTGDQCCWTNAFVPVTVMPGQ
jgi:hypothetical protein